MDYHKGSGVIVYDPFRGDMKRRVNNWCVVEVDREITRYFRWWMKFEKHIILQQPSWDAHISIVRGERLQPQFAKLWNKYHTRHVDFFYKHVGSYDVDESGRYDNHEANKGKYYFVEVECPLFNQIRDELGLKTGWSFHLTFGRTYEYEARKPKR